MRHISQATIRAIPTTALEDIVGYLTAKLSEAENNAKYASERFVITTDETTRHSAIHAQAEVLVYEHLLALFERQ